MFKIEEIHSLTLWLGAVAGSFLYEGVEEFISEGVVEIMTPDFLVGIITTLVAEVGIPIFVLEEGLKFLLEGFEWLPRTLIGRWNIVLDDVGEVIFSHLSVCLEVIEVLKIGLEGGKRFFP
jgi:hypothetical protein